MGKEKIVLKDICKSYYSETTVTQALHRINLSFSEGEFVAITGESGSGKSTLLRIIGGTDVFDEGEMFVDGETTSQYDEEEWEEYRRNEIGYVFQDYSLLGHYSALDNVISALLVMGTSQEQAEETAAEYLEQVGLKEYKNQKASKLSSGQRQRLSIARALAKNTGIIVADEPTGNLDSETGEQIIRLLRNLSKERLVIMVTHNYEQAEAYVTRKVRLHDGVVVSDVNVRQKQSEKERQEKTEEKPRSGQVDMQASSGSLLRGNKVAAYFARKNRRGQKGRALLFTAFLFVVSVVSFLFIGELYLQADDIFTKEYSEAAFKKKSEVRLVAKRTDEKELTKKDIEKMRTARNVVMVDSCDYANDFNFYIEEGRDYQYSYGAEQNGISDKEYRVVSFRMQDKFMMSTDCISKEDLKKGRMPESRNEVVLYSSDEKVLNSEIMCYFQAVNIWGPNEYYGKNLTVVGLLKEETSQVYFTTELCNMLSQRMDYGEYHVSYGRVNPEFFPMIAEDLSGNNAKISYKFFNRRTGEVTGPFKETIMQFLKYDKEGNVTGEDEEQEIYAFPPDEESHEMSEKMLEVSEEVFYKYYPKERENMQASVYITSYAKTDSVIRQLKKMGYEAKSTYRVSVTDYVEEQVNERMTILGISMIGLVIIFLAEILVLRSFMKIRIKDFQVLKFIGMRMELLRKISYFEISVYCFTAVAAAIVVMWILRIAGAPFLQEMMWYYVFSTYAVFVLYNFAAGFLTVFFFNRLLTGKLKEV